MDKYIYDESNGLWYELQGDYYIPCITLPTEKEHKFIGLWGQRYKRYLQEHKRAVYTTLLTSGKLNGYLADIDEQAMDMMFRLVEQMADKEGVTEQLKAENPIYSKWERNTYVNYLSKFELPADKRVKDFSKGMKVKLAFAVALSHKAELLILDEATSGLDPIIRDDILDILIDFVQDENHSVLVSSHIISDLEKVADYITFIHKGKLVFTHSKDELVDNYGVMSCGAMVFDNLDKSEIIAYRKEDYQYKVLVKDRHIAEKKYPKAIVVPAAIEEIMLFYVKGEMK